MPHLTEQPMYDPALPYADNYNSGPFGAYADLTAVKTTASPKFTFLGHPINSPFGIPAGPLLNAKYVTAALRKGYDIVTYKTQRSTIFEVNAFPNVLYVDVDGDLTLDKAATPLIGHTQTDADPKDLTITNSFGMPSTGPANWVPDLQAAIASAGDGQIVVMSVVGTIKPGFTPEDYYNDFAEVAKMAADAGAQVIEVNLSCPNVASEGVLCYTPAAVGEIAKRAKIAIGDLPLLTKIGYFAEDQQELLETVVKAMAPYVSGISAINTIPAPVVDETGEQALPGPNRLKSGMCGAGIKWAGLDMTRRLSGIRDKLNLTYEIIGVGGVMTAADYHEYRDAGADIVQSATGAMWNAGLAQEIKQSGL